MRLQPMLDCPIIMTEGVYEAIQNRFGAVLLDHVKLEGQKSSSKVYGLLDSQPVAATYDRLYKHGFSSLLQVCPWECFLRAAGAAG